MLADDTNHIRAYLRRLDLELAALPFGKRHEFLTRELRSLDHHIELLLNAGLTCEKAFDVAALARHDALCEQALVHRYAEARPIPKGPARPAG